MNLVLLGGNSSENEPWIREVEKNLQPYFDSTHVFTYSHWKTGEMLIDINLEITRIEKYVKNLGTYIIFAKSAGCLVVSKAIKERVINPKKCIFVGVPLDWAKLNSFDAPNWLSGNNTPTLIIQHTNDPFATSSQVKLLLDTLNIENTRLKEIPGNDHTYNEIDSLTNLIVSFVGK